MFVLRPLSVLPDPSPVVMLSYPKRPERGIRAHIAPKELVPHIEADILRFYREFPQYRRELPYMLLDPGGGTFRDAPVLLADAGGFYAGAQLCHIGAVVTELQGAGFRAYDHKSCVRVGIWPDHLGVLLPEQRDRVLEQLLPFVGEGEKFVLDRMREN